MLQWAYVEDAHKWLDALRHSHCRRIDASVSCCILSTTSELAPYLSVELFLVTVASFVPTAEIIKFWLSSLIHIVINMKTVACSCKIYESAWGSCIFASLLAQTRATVSVSCNGRTWKAFCSSHIVPKPSPQTAFILLTNYSKGGLRFHQICSRFLNDAFIRRSFAFQDLRFLRFL